MIKSKKEFVGFDKHIVFLFHQNHCGIKCQNRKIQVSTFSCCNLLVYCEVIVITKDGSGITESKRGVLGDKKKTENERKPGEVSRGIKRELIMPENIILR